MRKIGHVVGMGREIFLIEFSFESEEGNHLSNLYGDEKITIKFIWKSISNAFPRLVWLSVGRNDGLIWTQ